MPVILREAPRNPNCRLFHVDRELTDRIVEIYADPASAPSWIEALLRIDGVREVSLTRYKVRVLKRPDADWSTIEPALRLELPRYLGTAAWRDGGEAREDRTKSFPATTSVLPLGDGGRRVFEGRSAAGEHPLARRIFSLPGVAELILEESRILVTRGAAFPAEQVWDQVEQILAGAPGEERPDTS